jgi:hypothetical protein
MTTWIVTNRATGEVIHAYSADAPYPWDGMGFDTCNHIAEVPVVQAPPARELTKREWRLLFTDVERPMIDRFNATFETNTDLTDPQRDAVRSGMEDYKAATVVNKDDPATAQVLGLYVMLGILDASRPAEILA